MNDEHRDEDMKTFLLKSTFQIYLQCDLLENQREDDPTFATLKTIDIITSVTVGRENYFLWKLFC